MRIRLGATLHTVEGEARVLEGSLRVDPETGEASGRVLVDAGSLSTGNATRDANLHREVLESERHPRIVFEARALELVSREDDRADLVLRGDLTLLGEPHPIAIPARAVREPDGRVRATGEVTLPYVAWGLADVSGFLLRVDKEVTIQIDVSGQLRRQASAR